MKTGRSLDWFEGSEPPLKNNYTKLNTLDCLAVTWCLSSRCGGLAVMMQWKHPRKQTFRGSSRTWPTHDDEAWRRTWVFKIWCGLISDIQRRNMHPLPPESSNVDPRRETQNKKTFRETEKNVFVASVSHVSRNKQSAWLKFFWGFFVFCSICFNIFFSKTPFYSVPLFEFFKHGCIYDILVHLLEYVKTKRKKSFNLAHFVFSPPPTFCFLLSSITHRMRH